MAFQMNMLLSSIGAAEIPSLRFSMLLSGAFARGGGSSGLETVVLVSPPCPEKNKHGSPKRRALSLSLPPAGRVGPLSRWAGAELLPVRHEPEDGGGCGGGGGHGKVWTGLPGSLVG